jgi:hypothetical protein
VKIDYLWSGDERIHAINCLHEGTSLEVGILCLIAFSEETVRLANETNAFIVELPKEFRSGSERVKVFNAILNVLDHEQI